MKVLGVYAFLFAMVATAFANAIDDVQPPDASWLNGLPGEAPPAPPNLRVRRFAREDNVRPELDNVNESEILRRYDSSVNTDDVLRRQKRSAARENDMRGGESRSARRQDDMARDESRSARRQEEMPRGESRSARRQDDMVRDESRSARREDDRQPGELRSARRRDDEWGSDEVGPTRRQ